MMSADEHVWAVDSISDRIVKFDLSGHVEYSFGQFGTRPGYTWAMHQISADQEGNLYIAEVFGGRTQRVPAEAGRQSDPARPRPHADADGWRHAMIARRTIVVLALVAIAPATVAAQGRPNFSGTWKFTASTPPNYPGSNGWGVPSPTIVRHAKRHRTHDRERPVRRHSDEGRVQARRQRHDLGRAIEQPVGIDRGRQVENEGELGWQQTRALHLEHCPEPDARHPQPRRRPAHDRPRDRTAGPLDQRDADL